MGRGELPGRRCRGPAERQAAPVSSGSHVDKGAGGEDGEKRKRDVAGRGGRKV